jgi:hypothetical protein
LGDSFSYRFDNIGDPPGGFVMAQFKARDKLADPLDIWGEGSDTILHTVDIQDLRIRFESAIPPPGS